MTPGVASDRGHGRLHAHAYTHPDLPSLQELLADLLGELGAQQLRAEPAQGLADGDGPRVPYVVLLQGHEAGCRR